MDKHSGASNSDAKRMKLDTMDEELQQLIKHQKCLLDEEYAFLKTYLESFQNGFVGGRRVLDKFTPLGAIPEVIKQVKVLERIQNKQEILYKDLPKQLELIKEEALAHQEKEIQELSLEQMKAFFKKSIANLMRIQCNKPNLVECSSLQDGSSCSAPAAFLSSLEACSVSSLQASPPEANDSTLSTLQLQLKRLEEYEAIIGCPLYYKFDQQLKEVNHLMSLQHEQLTITEVVLDQLLLKSQQKAKELKEAFQDKSNCSAELKNCLFNTTSATDEEAPLFKASSEKEGYRQWLRSLMQYNKSKKKAKKGKSPGTITCAFYLKHKKRPCCMLVAKGKKFCGQHLVADDTPDENGRVRVPCPLDPNHSAYADAMEKHLEVCNARAPVHLPYYCKDVNAGTTAELETDSESALINVSKMPFSLDGRALADLSDEELLQLIHHIKTVEKDHTTHVREAVLSHSAVLTELESNPLSGPSFRKHLLQNSSLVAHLQRLGAFASPPHSSDQKHVSLQNGKTNAKSQLCFLEFGAGRGQLSHCVAAASNALQQLQVVLIDRGAQRYKFDTKMRDSDHVSTKRLRLDICDIQLEKVPGLQLESSVFAGGKHLCGAATDLTLRCVEKSIFRGATQRSQHSGADGGSATNFPADVCGAESYEEIRPFDEESSSVSSSSPSYTTAKYRTPCLSQVSFKTGESSSGEVSPPDESLFENIDKISTVRSDFEVHNLVREEAIPSDEMTCINCRENCMAESERASRGLVIALCCHHKCSWQHYVGKAFFKSIGLGEGDFPAVMGLTSWAVCAARPPAEGSYSGSVKSKTPSTDTGGQSPAADAGVCESSSETQIKKDQKCLSKASALLADGILSVGPLRTEPGSNFIEPMKSSTDVENMNCIPLSSEITNNSADAATLTTSLSLSLDAATDAKSSLGNVLVVAPDERSDHDAVTEGAAARNRYVRLGLSISEREEIGRAAKHIIDHGRAAYLTSRGLCATLVQYVDRDVTLENIALIAHQPT